MAERGYTPVHIVLQLDPPWTTDWMSPDARERLRQYGISAARPTPVMPRCQLTYSAALRQHHTSLISRIRFHGL